MNKSVFTILKDGKVTEWNHTICWPEQKKLKKRNNLCFNDAMNAIVNWALNNWNHDFRVTGVALVTVRSSSVCEFMYIPRDKKRYCYTN